MREPSRKRAWYRAALRLVLTASMMAVGCTDTQGSDAEEGTVGAGTSGMDEGKGAPAAQPGHIIKTEAELKQLLGIAEPGQTVQKASDGCLRVSIRSKENNLYVTSEWDWLGEETGILRARETAVVSAKERFWICNRNDGQGYTFRTDSSYVPWVSAEVGWQGDRKGVLRARATETGPWEHFDFIEATGGGHWAFTSRANGLWISAELSWSGRQYGILRARNGTFGPWELFIISIA